MEYQLADQQCTLAVRRISIKDILDFAFCPKYYDLKHRTADELNMKEAYDISLHNVFYAYLRALQNDTLKNSIEFLKYKWGKEWIKNKTSTEIILTPSALKRDLYDSKRRSGIDAIITFDKLMETPQCPIIINREYELQITDNIILTGVWEYIREVTIKDDKVFQILKFKTENNRFQVLGQMHHDLELTAAEMAFEQTFNGTAQLVYVDIYKKKMIPSYRAIQDRQMLIQTVKSVVQCLENNIRCVSPDKKCYHCEYRNECLK